MTKYIARFGAMRTLGVFTFPDDTPLRHGDSVILRTRRGQEVGTILREATEEVLGEFCGVPEDRVFRVMTRADEIEHHKMQEGEATVFQTCRRVITEMKLAMQLVRVEHIFGGERIIVYYVSEERIDFRDLVRALSHELQTRVEMRQVGVRDETRLLADCGDCGRDVCCNTHMKVMKEMQPIGMRMAKLQKATLDPSKISGRCGRLKCCLRHEYDLYSELQRGLPAVGKRVETPDGAGRVVNHEILAERVTVDLGEAGYKVYHAADLAAKNAPSERSERRQN